MIKVFGHVDVTRALRSLLERPWIPLLLSFALPAAFRAIPEVLAGPYPIGFDTVSWYAPIMGWTQRNGSGSALNLIFQSQRAPLFDILLVGVAALVPLHPFTMIKAVGPLLLGFFSLSTYMMVRTVFEAKRSTALTIALFVSLYFVTLRLSWDLFGNLFGYALFLLTLRQMHGAEGRGNGALFVLMAILTYLTHELVGALLLAFLLILVVRIWWKERKFRATYALLALAGFLALTYYAHWLVPPSGVLALGNIPVEPIKLGTNYLETDAFIGYVGIGDLYLSVLATSALVLLPLSVFFSRLRRPFGPIRIWTLVLLLAGLSPLIMPVFALLSWHRWIIMAAVPLAVHAGFRISQMLPRTIMVVGVALILVAGAYALLPAESAVPVFSSAYTVRSLPSSMLQNTGPLRDSPSTVAVLEWLQENAPPGSLLLSHYAFTGWAYIYAPDVEIRTYFRAINLDLNNAQNWTAVYTIWWIEKVGWYPEENIDSRFVLVHASDRMGIFNFVE